MTSTNTSGFSLVELVGTIAVSLVLVAIASLTMQPIWQQQHVTTAYNLTLTSLRRAHDQAAADMRVYVVTFGPAVIGLNGGTIVATQTTTTGPVLFSISLPQDVTYHVEPGVPTSPTVIPTTPDGFGTAAAAFDFDWGGSGDTGGGNTIYFYPDGSAQDANGNVNNGVVYMGMPGNLLSSRAVSLWGYTGRIRGWRLVKNGTAYSWSQQ